MATAHWKSPDLTWVWPSIHSLMTTVISVAFLPGSYKLLSIIPALLGMVIIGRRKVAQAINFLTPIMGWKRMPYLRLADARTNVEEIKLWWTRYRLRKCERVTVVLDSAKGERGERLGFLFTMMMKQKDFGFERYLMREWPDAKRIEVGTVEHRNDRPPVMAFTIWFPTTSEAVAFAIMEMNQLDHVGKSYLR